MSIDAVDVSTRIGQILMEINALPTLGKVTDSLKDLTESLEAQSSRMSSGKMDPLEWMLGNLELKVHYLLFEREALVREKAALRGSCGACTNCKENKKRKKGRKRKRSEDDIE